MTKNVHGGHRARMAARFLAGGFDGWQPHEILERLLFEVIPRRNTNETAHALIAAFGSLRGVLTAAPEELRKIPGIGPVSARYLAGILPEFTASLAAAYREEERLGRPGLLLLADFLLNFRGLPGAFVLLTADGRFLDLVTEPDAGSLHGAETVLWLTRGESLPPPDALRFLAGFLCAGASRFEVCLLAQDGRLTDLAVLPEGAEALF